MSSCPQERRWDVADNSPKGGYARNADAQCASMPPTPFPLASHTGVFKGARVSSLPTLYRGGGGGDELPHLGLRSLRLYEQCVGVTLRRICMCKGCEKGLRFIVPIRED